MQTNLSVLKLGIAVLYHTWYFYVPYEHLTHVVPSTWIRPNRRKLSQVNTLHPLELVLDPVPITFHILCVHSRLRVYKADGVIHCAIRGNVRELLDLVVCSPLIRVYSGIQSNMCLDYWQQCCCIPMWDKLHVSKCWLLWCVHKTKNPLLYGCWPTSVMLNKMNNECEVFS